MKQPTKKEIEQMSHETRMMRYKQEKDEILANAHGKTPTEISAELKEAIDRWKV